jgi:hypothetical protein
MHPIQFVSTMMVIQMKLMKAICNLKNMTNQEFQLDMEQQLMQLTKMKMHPIQFASMMIVIQMKLMKVICNHKNRTSQEFQFDVE